jgi:hypothetical protein
MNNTVMTHRSLPVAGAQRSCGLMARMVFVTFAALVASGCAVPRTHHCDARATASVQDQLVFGTAQPDGVVSLAQWQTFVAEVVTPHFPQGFSQWNADGQWRNADGTLAREASHVLMLVHDGSAAHERAIGEIVATYKSRFAQEAVLQMRTPVCVRW